MTMSSPAGRRPVLVVGRRETSAERREATRAWLDHYVGKGAFPEIEDIVMRALTPRELFNCQGFPHDYIIDPKVRGKGLSPTSQVRLVGNSVPPTMARVVVQANIASEIGEVAA
jgi:site-specific DNA-cytosine methylase